MNTKATMKLVQRWSMRGKCLKMSAESLVHYELGEPNSDRFFFLGSNLKERERTELVEFLKANVEVLS